VVSVNKLTTEKRWLVVRALVEGCSIRATDRMTGVAQKTIVKLLVDLDTAYADYQVKTLRILPCKRLPLDEIWLFVAMKAKHVPQDKQRQFGFGDVGPGPRPTPIPSSCPVGWRPRVT
jgi:hypothetical protein